ncbi:MAG: DUF433 domain-containing protein [Candidatus Firestonebacteria bacterium]
MNKFSFLSYEKGLEYTKWRTTTTTTTIINILVLQTGIYYSNRYSLANEAVFRTLLITKNPKICQGKPIILGTRISVTNIVELHFLLGWDIQKIRDEYPHLNTQQIIAAIEYYENHTKEIDLYLQEEKEVNA